MDISSPIGVVRFKSSFRALCRSFFKSRENWVAKYRALQQKFDDTTQVIQRQALQIQALADQLSQSQQELKSERLNQAQAARRLPVDLPIGNHGYGAKLIALAVNLARASGLRASEKCLKLFFEYLGVDERIPDWTTIRTWLQRLGVASMTEDIDEADDWIWMADHSNQIGQEKVLAVLAIRASEMPPPGEAITHEQLHVLTVQPGKDWKREDVAKVYQKLAKRYGYPRAVLTDGAIELQESAECLQITESKTIILKDFKHKAANYLKALIEKDPQFIAFGGMLGQTRSAIQQTELAHLTPPSPKQKARFMNLSATMNWASAILWLLQNPQAKARELVTAKRLEEKLGWIRAYADDVAAWSECQRVIDISLTFINQQGVFRGAGKQLRGVLPKDLKHAISQKLAENLIKFVTQTAKQLKKGERVPGSTEILESSFGLYKQLERQHSKSGFTSLIASYGALLKKATPAGVKQALTRVSVKQMRQWTKDNLGLTVHAKRKATYQEFKSQTKCATTSASYT